MSKLIFSNELNLNHDGKVCPAHVSCSLVPLSIYEHDKLFCLRAISNVATFDEYKKVSIFLRRFLDFLVLTTL